MIANKILVCVLSIVLSIMAVSPYGAGSQTSANKVSKINLTDFYLDLPNYSPEEVNTEALDMSETQAKVNIVDKSSGKVLESIVCDKIDSNDPKAKSDNQLSNSEDISFYVIQREKTDELATVRLEVVVELYKSGSSSCIQNIISSDMSVYSDCDAELEDAYTHTRSVSGSFPTTNIEYLGNAVIAIKTSKTRGENLDIGYSISEVNKFGYPVDPNISGEITLCKVVGIQGNFYTYSDSSTVAQY